MRNRLQVVWVAAVANATPVIKFEAGRDCANHRFVHYDVAVPVLAAVPNTCVPASGQRVINEPTIARVDEMLPYPSYQLGQVLSGNRHGGDASRQ
jgi:hypothetical protein